MLGFQIAEMALCQRLLHQALFATLHAQPEICTWLEWWQKGKERLGTGSWQGKNKGSETRLDVLPSRCIAQQYEGMESSLPATAVTARTARRTHARAHAARPSAGPGSANW